MGLLIFLGYMFLEILFSYEFTKIVTPFGFFLEILISAGYGIYIIKTLQFSMYENLILVMRREITEEDFMSIGLFKLVGAILLIIPGIFSDIVGILFLIEPIAIIIARKIFPRRNRDYKTPQKDDDIIDVEILE